MVSPVLYSFLILFCFILIISRLAETKTTSERLAAEAESAATERGTAGGKSVILFLALFPEGVSNKSSPLLSHPQALAVSTIKSVRQRYGGGESGSGRGSDYVSR